MIIKQSLLFSLLFTLCCPSSFAHKGDHDHPDEKARELDAFERMERMQEKMFKRMERLFDDREGTGPGSGFSSFFKGFDSVSLDDSLEVEQHEDGDFKYVTVNVEGISKDSLKIDIEQGAIALQGKVTKTSRTDGDNSRISSSYTSSFRRQFPVPTGVDEAAVKIEQKDQKIVLKFPKTKI